MEAEELVREAFKAGEEQGIQQERARHDLSYCEAHKLYYCDCCPDCFLGMGRREVVEQVNLHKELFVRQDGIKHYQISIEWWDARLKSWGL